MPLREGLLWEASSAKNKSKTPHLFRCSQQRGVDLACAWVVLILLGNGSKDFFLAEARGPEDRSNYEEKQGPKRLPFRPLKDGPPSRGSRQEGAPPCAG